MCSQKMYCKGLLVIKNYNFQPTCANLQGGEFALAYEGGFNDCVGEQG